MGVVLPKIGKLSYSLSSPVSNSNFDKEWNASEIQGKLLFNKNSLKKIGGDVDDLSPNVPVRIKIPAFICDDYCAYSCNLGLFIVITFFSLKDGEEIRSIRASAG
jgi:hypothetical protein